MIHTCGDCKSMGLRSSREYWGASQEIYISTYLHEIISKEEYSVAFAAFVFLPVFLAGGQNSLKTCVASGTLAQYGLAPPGFRPNLGTSISPLHPSSPVDSHLGLTTWPTYLHPYM